VLLVLRAGGQAIGWGFQLQSPAVVASLTLLMLAVALNLAGAFEIGARLQGLGGARLSRLPGGPGALDRRADGSAAGQRLRLLTARGPFGPRRGLDELAALVLVDDPRRAPAPRPARRVERAAPPFEWRWSCGCSSS
jgi:hypothetical protein